MIPLPANTETRSELTFFAWAVLIGLAAVWLFVGFALCKLIWRSIRRRRDDK